LGFPSTPVFATDYFSLTVKEADVITTPHRSYLTFIPKEDRAKVKIISNGVDFKLFCQPPDVLPLAEFPSPIILYVGAIDKWFDFEIVKRVARTYSNGSVVLIGPIANVVYECVQDLLAEENVTHFPAVPYTRVKDFVHAADVCIIPFVKNKLTESVLPNKLFEYAAAGKTTLVSNFNPHLREYRELIYRADTASEFVENLAVALESPKVPEDLQRIAATYDWRDISRSYRELLVSLLPVSDSDQS